MDELVVFTAGLAIGGDGTPAIAGMGIDDLGLATRFDLATVRRRWSRHPLDLATQGLAPNMRIAGEHPL